MKYDKLQKTKAETAGFTLVEIVAVLVLLGILAAVAVPKFFDLSSDAEKKAAEAALMEAQVRINAGYSKAVYAGKSCEDAVDGVSSLAKIGDGGKNVINGYTLTLQDGDELKEAPGSYVTLTKSGKSFDSSTFDNLKQIFKPTCDTTNSDDSASGGLVCPGTGGTNTEVVTCKPVSIACEGTVTCSCSESGEMNCTCVAGGNRPGTDDDKLKPGFDAFDKTVLPFKWEYSSFYADQNGVGFAQGNVIEDDGKYYALAWNNYFNVDDCKNNIIDMKKYVANTAEEIWQLGKWLIPFSLDESNWAIYENVNGQMQWLKLNNGEWKTSWGVTYGNLCYENGSVYVYKNTSGTDAPGTGNWLKLTALKIYAN